MTSIQVSDDWTVMTFATPADVERYLVEAGSVAVDGVSLTVASVHEGEFSVSLGPDHALRDHVVGPQRER